MRVYGLINRSLETIGIISNIMNEYDNVPVASIYGLEWQPKASSDEMSTLREFQNELIAGYVILNMSANL